LAIARALPEDFVQALLQGPDIIESYAQLATAVADGDADRAALAADKILAPSVASVAGLD
jgi:hypothetical protein